MNAKTIPEVGRFAWLDLAARDAEVASAFYGALFGWRPRVHAVGGGTTTRFCVNGRDVASLYQLSPRHIGEGVPSHWTPYVAVANTTDASMRAARLGAEIIVPPFDVPGLARIALLQDSVGAVFGLWQAVWQEDGSACRN